MYPLIRSGATLAVEPIAARDVRIGDIVLARLERGLTAHRLVRIERDGAGISRLVTRGDNCLVDDPPFVPEQLLGRVDAIASVQFGIFRLIIRLFAYRWVRGAVNNLRSFRRTAVGSYESLSFVRREP